MRFLIAITFVLQTTTVAIQTTACVVAATISSSSTTTTTLLYERRHPRISTANPWGIVTRGGAATTSDNDDDGEDDDDDATDDSTTFVADEEKTAPTFSSSPAAVSKHSSSSKPIASSIPKGGSESIYAIQLEVVKEQVLVAASASVGNRSCLTWRKVNVQRTGGLGLWDRTLVLLIILYLCHVVVSLLCTGNDSPPPTPPLPKLEELRKSIVNEGTVVSEFGKKADAIVNKALEDFAKSAPSATNVVDETDYEGKLVQLETALDAPLQVLYLKGLQLIREDALQRYKTASKTSGASEYEAMLQADAYFVRMAEDATRTETTSEEWDYSSERTALQAVMNNLAASGKKVVDIQVQSAQQQQTAMQFLQQQQQMIQQLQMQLYGQTSPWNVGVAYRIPDTNFNLQGSYQQGRANVQLSCVPDEYAPFLGPNGFTNGVGPGNLGLSVNLSV
jgi:hypothetical protein